MEKTRLIPNTQPISCQFRLYCGGATAKYMLARSPARALWVPLCEKCAREMLENVPDELIPAPAVVEMVTETPSAADVEAKETASEPVSGAYTCVCGKSYSGPAARANLARHQASCEAYKASLKGA